VNTAITRIKVCLNGRRSRREHPAVPVSPRELASAGAAAVAEGAQAVHLHARGADGAESVLAADVGAAVRAVRETCPATPIGVSTGLWITDGDVARRLSAVTAWVELPASDRPDFASVNVSEPGWSEVHDRLVGAGIAVEAGLFTVSDAETVAADADRDWLRILVEIVDGPPERAADDADRILRRLEELQVPAPLLLHGVGSACWPLIAHAGSLGLATRIGLEDTTTAPQGGPVDDNAELVRHALQLWMASARR
jgi:uncharacterized protein (DUF849 family)